jgi:hypothetical protein
MDSCPEIGVSFRDFGPMSDSRPHASPSGGEAERRPFFFNELSGLEDPTPVERGGIVLALAPEARPHAREERTATTSEMTTQGQPLECHACGGYRDCPSCAGRRSSGCTICGGSGRCPVCSKPEPGAETAPNTRTLTLVVAPGPGGLLNTP